MSLLSGARRRVAPPEAMVATEPPPDGRSPPLLVRPAAKDVALAGWIAANREQTRQWLDLHGAVLFRGFGSADATGLASLLRATGAEPLDYTERSSPRREVSGRVYTSTEHPAHAEIPLHCENSYQTAWPALLMFLCRVPAETGGETPLADTRRIRARLPPDLVDRFRAHGVMYRRCLDGRLGLSWQEVLGTTDRNEAEHRCTARGLRFSWRADGALRTQAVRPLMDRHPRTGEPIWFNHMLFFHPSSLDAEAQAAFAGLASEDLPNDTRFGDGSPVPDDAVAALRDAHQRETMRFTWQSGDVLLLDNMLAAHGRGVFTGRREVLVAMG
jgi:alpha-ketoglutarate-dependent taurine dioxygenase